jgi:hypothetical protein
LKGVASTTVLQYGTGKAKIIISGLDGAGKSTILDLVQNKMVNVIDAQPRKGLGRREAEIMGNAIMICDLGGQEHYQKLYLTKPAYFEQASAYVFVVDLQNALQYGDALEYFEQSLLLFNGFEMRPKLYLLLHKFDDEYRADYYDPSRKVRNEFMGLKSRFDTIARKCGFAIDEVYRTSVSDMWSVYSAFYDVWTAIILRLDSIESYLTRFFEDVSGVRMAVLMDASCNVISRMTSEGASDIVDDLVTLAMNAIGIMGKIKGTKAGAKIKDISSASVVVADNCILIRKIDAEGKTFYVIVVKECGPEYEARWVINQLAESLAVFLSVPGNGITT